MFSSQDTIVAQATPPGKGGVGIIRISGKSAAVVATQLLGYLPKPRQADYCNFKDVQGQTLDQGIAIYFKAPHSFTGEDVLELQGHGGPIVLNLLQKAILDIKGTRLAKPGEFSERAFLNDKLDLAQAEAISDLIEASSEQAAKSALLSLQGGFSKHIDELLESLIHLRMYVEAAIDFPEEEIDFLADEKLINDIQSLQSKVKQTLAQTKQGSILRDGMKVVIAGRPNAGKSSLLNALAGKESAIVTDIPGTTRDVLKEHIHLDGMPLHIFDTAGLRESTDKVEQIGIDRAWQEIRDADRILMLVDSTETSEQSPEQIWPEFYQQLPENIPITVVRNKCDLSNEEPGKMELDTFTKIHLSAKQGLGVPLLKQHLIESMGYQQTAESQFIARTRHVIALEQTLAHVDIGFEQLQDFAAGEILAEELRIAQQFLSEITGAFSSDDLLGRIFSSFCIGK